MGANSFRPGMAGGMRPPQYSPPAGTPSGIPGAQYPVMGSAPVSQPQARYAQPMPPPQMHPGMGAGMPPQGMPPQAPRPGMQANPQQLATALTQLSGGAPARM